MCTQVPMLGFQWPKWDTNSYHKHNSIYFARCNNVSFAHCMQSKMQFIRITIARLKRQSELQNSNYSTYEWTFRACVLSDLHATIVTDLHLNHIRKLAVHGAGQWTHFVYWMIMTHMKRAIELCYTECFGLTNKPVKIVFSNNFLFIHVNVV